jgi:hypothetical protein
MRVGDVLEPLDGLAVELLLDGEAATWKAPSRVSLALPVHLSLTAGRQPTP